MNLPSSKSIGQSDMRTPKTGTDKNLPQREGTRTLMKGKGDPKQILANVADKYLKIGEKLGLILWLIWVLITISTFIIGFTNFYVTFFSALIITNLLLVSPKLVYKITVLILDLIGVGEVLTALNKVGLDKVNIKISDWQKFSIIALDLIFITIGALIAGFIISVACSVLPGLCA